MKINFNNGDSGKYKHKVGKMTRGDKDDMDKMRKKQLPEIQENIQRVLENYKGESICILVQHENEDGMPDHVDMFMAGVSRLESQLGLAKGLDVASKQALQVVMESADGDLKAMMRIVKTIAEMQED